MEEKLKSEGKCLFCDKLYSKAGINRHIKTHLDKKVISSKPGKSFLLKITTDKSWGSTPYFLTLWMDGEAKMSQLDAYLKSIWLECCGHMSAFRIPQKKVKFDGSFDFFETANFVREDEVNMKHKAKAVFEEKLTLAYEYDFGSTTALDITVVAEYAVKADEKLMLLSRNEPLAIMCTSCGVQPALESCTVCSYSEPHDFCESCAEEHSDNCEDFQDYAALPIVNSPRTGVCAYMGGELDVERDGAFNQL